MPREITIWGIDLGGTKIECVVLRQHSSAFDILARERIPTDAHLGYEHILHRVSELVQSISKKHSLVPKTIGVGHPGVVAPATRLLKNSNTLCLNGRRLRDDLGQVLNCAVACANDANCFALAEAVYGAGNGFDTVFGVILGTGVGGGVVVNQKALFGRQGIAGEWGHNILLPDGEPCYCGKRGCVETVISGPALERYHAQQSGRSLGLESIVQEAKEGVATAKNTIKYLTQHFGRAIAAVINILDPHCIVLGGGVSNIDALYFDGVEEAKRYVFNTEPDILIRKHQLGDSAGVIGAALLVASES